MERGNSGQGGLLSALMCIRALLKTGLLCGETIQGEDAAITNSDLITDLTEHKSVGPAGAACQCRCSQRDVRRGLFGNVTLWRRDED